MMHIVKAGVDVELIVWLVVVGFTLISQIARAARQKPKPGRPAAARTAGSRPGVPRSATPQRPLPASPAHVPPPPSNAQKELEDFLASLAGQPPPNRQTPARDEEAETDFEPVFREVAPPPPPPPRPVRATPRPQRRPQSVAASPMVVVNRETVRVDRPEAPAPVESIGTIRELIGDLGDDPYGVAQLSETRAIEVRELRAALAHDSHDRNSLRKAILLKEILDAPLALRQTRPIGG